MKKTAPEIKNAKKADRYFCFLYSVFRSGWRMVTPADFEFALPLFI